MSEQVKDPASDVKDPAAEAEQIKKDAELAKKLSEEEEAAAAAAARSARSRPPAWAPRPGPIPADPSRVEEGVPWRSSGGPPWNENWSCEEEGIFGCGEDFCTTFFVICCGWLTSAQLYQRVIGPKGVFYWILAIYLTLWMLELIFSGIHAHVALRKAIIERYNYPDGSYSQHVRYALTPTLWSGLATAAHAVFLFVCFLLVMLVRGALRRRDGLTAKQCCGLEDACYSSFFFPCTSCLLMRRVGLRDFTYWFFSPDGGVDALAEQNEGRPILGGRGSYRAP